MPTAPHFHTFPPGPHPWWQMEGVPRVAAEISAKHFTTISCCRVRHQAQQALNLVPAADRGLPACQCHRPDHVLAEWPGPVRHHPPLPAGPNVSLGPRWTWQAPHFSRGPWRQGRPGLFFMQNPWFSILFAYFGFEFFLQFVLFPLHWLLCLQLV